jgi:hypothetical protein
MAVTIEAPPSRVWPWLVQMGRDRGGWYSWDRLDNGGRPSAWALHPEWQSISVGQRLQSDQGGKHWFEVAGLLPERFLGLRATMTPTGRQFDPAVERPRYFSDSLWAFELKELPQSRTRLIVSVYSANRPRWWGALSGFVFWEPAYWIMQTRQFTNLKRRAEGTYRPRQETRPTTRHDGVEAGLPGRVPS